LNNNYKNH